MERIVKACREVQLQGCTNDDLLAFVLVLRYSGLRIGDAAMLTLERFKEMIFSSTRKRVAGTSTCRSAFRDEPREGDRTSSWPVFVYWPGVRAHGDGERSLAAEAGPDIHEG